MQTYLFKEKASGSAEEIKPVLQTEKFNLPKFPMNKQTTLENLLAKQRTELQTQTIAGQTWDSKTDKLIFAKPTLLYTGQQLTQRKVLSKAASLFDPVGQFSAVAIRIRCILLKIINMGGSDHLVSQSCQQELQEWM